MIIENNSYIVATKSFPILFIIENGELTENVSLAQKFSDRISAQTFIDEDLDNPNGFIPIPLKVTYQI